MDGCAEGDSKQQLEELAREMAAFCKEIGVDFTPGHDGTLLVNTTTNEYIYFNSVAFWLKEIEAA